MSIEQADKNGICIDTIPEEMRALAQWVGCDGFGSKNPKAPIDPGTGYGAKADDPRTWGTFETAYRELGGGHHGLGFEFEKDGGFVGIDLDACRDQMRGYLALYIGGMGSKKQNFHKDVVVRYGYGEVADQIQDLYLAGKKREAMAAIPAQLIDDVCLVGPKEHIRDQLAVWKECRGITTMLLSINGYQPSDQMETLATVAEMVWS